MLGNKLISGILIGLGAIILAVKLLNPNSFGSQQINLKNTSSALKNSSLNTGVSQRLYNSSAPCRTNTTSPSPSNPTPTTTQSPPSARW
jgi:hypothetical protein